MYLGLNTLLVLLKFCKLLGLYFRSSTLHSINIRVTQTCMDHSQGDLILFANCKTVMLSNCTLLQGSDIYRLPKVSQFLDQIRVKVYR